MKRDLPNKEIDRQRTIPPFVSVLLDARSDSLATMRLAQNAPNPFSHMMRTEIAFAVDTQGHVTLRILDASGSEIARLYDHPDVPSGHYRVAWLGVDSTGTYVDPGLYRYQLVTENWTLTRSLLIMPRLQGLADDDSDVPLPLYPGAMRTLEALIAAHRERDFELYQGLFAEDFRRIVAPGNSSWGREEELEAIRGLFASPSIASIAFNPRFAAVRDSVTRTPRILTVSLSGGELLILSQDGQELRVPFGSDEIVLRQGDRATHSNDSAFWEIVEWRERRVEQTSNPE